MIIAIIQARMGSTRLPGKVLKEIAGMTLLEYQVKRVLLSKMIDKVIVATSTLDQDNAIEDLCKKIDVDCFRGSECDVLSRYYEAAKKYEADIIARLTADCPFSDPAVIDAAIKLFIDTGSDYVANTAPAETSKFPDGSDVEVFSMKALERANREAKDPPDREHVTFYFWKYGKDFKAAQLTRRENWSKYRFTVDYQEDLEVIDFIARELIKRNSFGHLEEIIDILDKNPEIKEKNSRYYFGIGWGKK